MRLLWLKIAIHFKHPSDIDITKHINFDNAVNEFTTPINPLKPSG
jgi:hypothetical protein